MLVPRCSLGCTKNRHWIQGSIREIQYSAIKTNSKSKAQHSKLVIPLLETYQVDLEQSNLTTASWTVFALISKRNAASPIIAYVLLVSKRIIKSATVRDNLEWKLRESQESNARTKGFLRQKCTKQLQPIAMHSQFLQTHHHWSSEVAAKRWTLPMTPDQSFPRQQHPTRISRCERPFVERLTAWSAAECWLDASPKSKSNLPLEKHKSVSLASLQPFNR